MGTELHNSAPRGWTQPAYQLGQSVKVSTSHATGIIVGVQIVPGEKPGWEYRLHFGEWVREELLTTKDADAVDGWAALKRHVLDEQAAQRKAQNPADDNYWDNDPAKYII